VKLVGRVFADVNSLVSGSGIGPKYRIFLLETTTGPDKGSDKTPKLFRIVYEYFDQKFRLGKDFFDHRILYELKVKRKSSCDAKISEFAYEQNGDSEPPTNILHILEGSDSKLVNETQTLPCYVLNESNYKIIDRPTLKEK
jgi:hypothetical protein